MSVAHSILDLRQLSKNVHQWGLVFPEFTCLNELNETKNKKIDWKKKKILCLQPISGVWSL